MHTQRNSHRHPWHSSPKRRGQDNRGKANNEPTPELTGQAAGTGHEPSGPKAQNKVKACCPRLPRLSFALEPIKSTCGCSFPPVRRVWGNGKLARPSERQPLQRTCGYVIIHQSPRPWIRGNRSLRCKPVPSRTASRYQEGTSTRWQTCATNARYRAECDRKRVPSAHTNPGRWPQLKSRRSSYDARFPAMAPPGLAEDK